MSQILVTGEAKVRDIQGPVVANSGVITALDGGASQYVRGDGTLADFPTSTGGGSSVSYYLNSSVSQGTIGGVAYRQLSKTPISGAGTDITASTNGYIASYITDANDPALLEVPAGNFNCEFYFSVNNNTGNPFTYAEVYKYDGTTFTLLGTSVGVPEYITEGTVINPYYFAVPVSSSVLSITDRIAIRIYVNVDGRVVTLHTENNHLCQVVTTFSKGLTSLNNLTRQVQFLATGTSGTDFNIVSSVATHTFNIPNASAISRGFITNGVQTIAGNKTFSGQNTFEDINKYNLGILMSQSGGGSTSTGYTSFSAYGTNGVLIGTITQSNILTFNSTALRTYTFPDLSGTLALLEAENIFTDVNSFDFGINYKTDASLANVSGYISQGYAKSGTGSGSTLSLKIADGNSVKAINLDFVGSPATYTYTFPDASGTIALTSNLGSYLPLAGGIMTGSILLNNNISISGQLFGTSSYANMLSMSPSDKVLIDNSGRGVIFGGTIGQGTYTYTLPSATGTLALTSNLSSYVPYTGATTNVNLGSNYLTSTGLINSGGFYANGFGGTSAGYLNLKQGSSFGGNNGFASIAGYDFASVNGIIMMTYASGSSKNIVFDFDLLSTTTRFYKFPNADGTVSLTSDLSAYLPLSGGTLTGALSGTSATFSGAMRSNGIEVTNSANADILDIFQSPSALNSFIDYPSGRSLIIRNKGSLGNLTLASTGAATFSSSVTAGGDITIPNGNYYYARRNTGGSAINVMGFAAASDTLVIKGGTSGAAVSMQFQDTAGPVMSLYNGNVGIGTSSPTANLTIYNATVPYMNLKNASSGTYGTVFGFADSSGNAEIWNYDNGYLRFATNGTERMRITSGGDVYFGAAISGANSFNFYKIYSGGNPGFQICNSSAAAVLSFNGNSQLLYLANLTGGATTLSVDASGNIIRTPSDLNLKNNIEDLQYGLETIMQLRPIKHNWEESIQMGEGKSIGFIAQELETLIPEIVCGNEYKSIDYPKLTAVLVKAIQELTQKVKQLENK